MIAKFRIIHFTPDPMLGTVLPIGAVVVDKLGNVTPVRRQHVPSTQCLGGNLPMAIAAQMASRHIDFVKSFDRLPPIFGPLVCLSEARSLPVGVEDPVGWVDRQLNPCWSKKASKGPSHVQRATQGFMFFKTHELQTFVHRTFDPKEEGARLLGKAAIGLRPIAHWAGTIEAPMLMEPLVLTRPKVAADIDEIAARFRGWSQVTQDIESQVKFVVYTVSGEVPDSIRDDIDSLRDVAEIIETYDRRQRDSFIEEVRSLPLIQTSAPILH